MERSSDSGGRVTTTHRFGGCPECGDQDGYVNVGRSHWIVCDPHRTKWWVGENLFSSWRDEDEETWRKNKVMLAGYREVEPVQAFDECDVDAMLDDESSVCAED